MIYIKIKKHKKPYYVRIWMIYIKNFKRFIYKSASSSSGNGNAVA